MSRILITGGTGFVGKHLKKYLSQEKTNKVFISSRQYKEIDCIKLNLINYQESRRILSEYTFDKIFHLSAQPSVHISWEQPFSTIQDNINSTLNLIRIAQEFEIKLIIAGTSEVYKETDNQMTEESELDPRSPYTISKLTIDYFVRIMSEKLNLNCTILRLFNVIGALQDDKFVISSFARQLAKIKLEKQKTKKIKVGNLNVYRDFVDVRDVVKTFELVSNNKEYGEVYNVCSGVAYKLSTLLDDLIKIADVNVKIEIDQDRVREKDKKYFCGNYDKIKEKYNWEPKILINRSLEDIYSFWFEKERKL